MKLTRQDVEDALMLSFPMTDGKTKVYGVPRGGWNIAMLIEHLKLGKQVFSIEEADIIVDDVIDSGQTRAKFDGKEFYTPYEKLDNNEWIEFPWEERCEIDAEDTITRMIEHIGEDPKRPGLLETPARVIRSWKELYAGYEQNPEDVLNKLFDSDANQIVLCKDIEFYSTCEHHLIPFFGKAHVGYIPSGKVVGLSKLARLVDVYARRLQIQEQLSNQVADAIEKHVPGCKGIGVVIEAKHLCMCARGVAKQSSYMKTSALRGMILDDSKVRKEFFDLL